MGKFINDFAHNKSKSSNAKESLITQNGMKYRLPIISSNISSVPAISKKIHIIAKYIKEKKLKEKNGMLMIIVIYIYIEYNCVKYFQEIPQ